MQTDPLSHPPVHHTSTEGTRWSRVNAAEALPGVIRPLSWSAFGEATNRSWRMMFERLGLVRPGDHLPKDGDSGYMRTFFGRSSINVDMMMACMGLFPGDKAGDHARELFSETGPSNVGASDRSRLDLDLFVQCKRDILDVIAAEHSKLHSWWKRSLADIRNGTAKPAALFVDAVDRYVSAQANHSINSTLCQQYFSEASKFAELAGRTDLAAKLTTGLADTFDTRSMMYLWQISRGTRKLEDYLGEFGFQTSLGDDIFETSWREDDSALQALLKTFSKLADDNSPLAKEHMRTAEREEAESIIIAALPEAKRVEARALFGQLADSTRARELGKASYKIALDVARAAARKRGKELQKLGLIDAQSDVFFLNQTEAMVQIPDNARSLIAARKLTHDHHCKIEIPTSWEGNPVPISHTARTDDEPVIGLGVSPGIATGRVRLVIDHQAAEDMEPGDILVTRTTDPSWGPFFMVAGGLVIDIGGAMSHGAIIARELGIPCVINTQDGTRRLADGAMVQVDGNRGVVRLAR